MKYVGFSDREHAAEDSQVERQATAKTWFIVTDATRHKGETLTLGLAPTVPMGLNIDYSGNLGAGFSCGGKAGRAKYAKL
jgi:hypothetical protein